MADGVVEAVFCCVECIMNFHLPQIQEECALQCYRNHVYLEQMRLGCIA